MTAHLSPEDRDEWDVDPDEWPHTPPFHVFRALMDEDDNTWWRAGSGHGLNAYDAAIERIEAIEALIPTQNPELIEAGYSVAASDLLAAINAEM